MIDLGELKKKALAATGGNWQIGYVRKNVVYIDTEQSAIGIVCDYRMDATFIVAANPAVVLELIERVEKAEASVMSELEREMLR